MPGASSRRRSANRRNRRLKGSNCIRLGTTFEKRVAPKSGWHGPPFRQAGIFDVCVLETGTLWAMMRDRAGNHVRERAMGLRINETAPDFTAETTQGTIQFPRMDRRRLGRAVLASEEFHAGLHDRARHDGRAGRRVRQAQRQDHRHLGRPGGEPRQMEGRHQDGNRPFGRVSADRRPRPQGGQALRHAAGRGRRAARKAARRPTTRRCARCS